MTARRRILFVTPIAPRTDAHEGGSRVMAGTITAMAQRHDVGILYLQGPDDAGLGDVAEACTVVERVLRPWARGGLGKRVRQLHLASAVAAGLPLWPGRWWVPECATRLRQVVAAWRPDVVQFEFHVMGQYAEGLDGEAAGRVLVEHEPGEQAARERRLLARGGARFAAAADHLAWRRYERRILRAVDRAVVFTERDRAALLPLCGSTPVVRIPFGVTLPPHPANPRGAAMPTILFSGNFRHAPNEDAARYLIGHIFPRVRARRADARLVVAGSHPPAWLSSAACDSVEIASSVPDMRPYLDDASVVVVPVRLGGGMRVKLLDALAAGKAVVSSPLGIEGVDVTDGKEVRTATTADEFAARIVELLDSGDDRERLGGSARAWVASHMGWERTASAFDDLYSCLAAERGDRRLLTGTARAHHLRP